MDPDPDSDLWLDLDSMNMDPKHCYGLYRYLKFLQLYYAELGVYTIFVTTN